MDVKRVNTSEFSYEEFYEEHWKPGIPVVFQDATKCWKAHNEFTPDWLREKFGDRKTVVEGTEYTMNELMDLIEGIDTSRPVPYPCKYHMQGQLPELMDHISPIGLGYAKPNWLESSWFSGENWGGVIEMFIGGPGGQFPYIHLDYYHLSAWVSQIYGKKQFTVWPRGQEEFLYMDPDDPWKSLLMDHENPDYEKYPLYKNATPIKFTMGPGETLYIPVGIWHTAKSLEPTISIAFDLLNQQNFPAFLKDVWGFRKDDSKLKAAAVTGYAAIGGAMCWMGDKVGKKRGANIARP